MSHKGRSRPPDGSSAFASLHLSFMLDYQAQPSPRGACGASATVFSFSFFYFQNWLWWKTMNYFNDLLSIPRGMQSLETDAQQLWRCWCFRRWMSANKTYEVNENTAVARGGFFVTSTITIILLLGNNKNRERCSSYWKSLQCDTILQEAKRNFPCCQI